MSESNRVDRNLLFGLLCLINDLVDQQSLVEGVRLWMEDSSRPLDQLLVDRGLLKLEDREFVLPLVEKHLERHAGDAARSLAALSSISTVVQDLRGLQDPRISGTLDLVSRTAFHSANSGTSSLSAGAFSSGAASTRFHVVKYNVGEGGLGIISCALDNDFWREVAVKQIKPQWADDPHERARFLHEAEVTGLLEHPGVVPVYGLGADETGRPFYAMKFIGDVAALDQAGDLRHKAPGDTLWQAIKRFHAARTGQDLLGLQKLLRRFVDVCNVVDFAHSRGVLHRDLKPGNIMLGEFGETLVVDWGLARTMPRSSVDVEAAQQKKWIDPPSAQGLAPDPDRPLGTYEFMSPEQAAGQISQLGVATDVYSLGATLYCILTGQYAVSRTNKHVLEDIKAGRFDRPSVKNPDVPRALEAVCLKAMALRPEDRYASARALAADIESWMADDPVSAWKEPLTVRAQRWMKRHPRTVASTIAAVSIGIVVSLVANHLVARQRDIAEHNFEHASQTVEDYMLTVSQSMLFNEPRMIDLRMQLLQKAKTHFEELANIPGNSSKTRFYRASANYNLGLLELELGNRRASAQKCLRTAVALLDDRAPSRLSDDELLLASKALTQLGNMYTTLADDALDNGLEARQIAWAETAKLSYQKAVSTRQTLNGRYPQNAEYWRLTASAHMNLAGLYEQQAAHAEFAAAEAAVGQAIKLALDEQSRLESKRTKAKILFGHARTLQPLDHDRALKMLDEASTLFAQIMEQSPSNANRDWVAEGAQCIVLAYQLDQVPERKKAAVFAKDDLIELLQDFEWVKSYDDLLTWTRRVLGEDPNSPPSDSGHEALVAEARNYAIRLAEEAQRQLLATDDMRAKDLIQRSISVLVDAIKSEPHEPCLEPLIEDFVLYSKGVLKQWPQDEPVKAILKEQLESVCRHPMVDRDRFEDLERRLRGNQTTSGP